MTESTPETTETQHAEGTAPQETQTDTSNANTEVNYEEKYKNIEPAYTRGQQELKQTQSELATLKDSAEGNTAKTEFYDQMDNSVHSSPEKMALLQNILGQQANTDTVDPALQDDPVYQHTRKLEQELAQLKQDFGSLSKGTQKREVNDRIKSEVVEAKNTYKEMFGRDATDEQVNNILKEMDESNVYNAKIVTKAMYSDEYAKSKTQEILSKEEAKRNMFSNVTSMNSSAAVRNEKQDLSLRESFSAAIKEQIEAI